MANITIDGKDYDLNDLNDKAKEQLANLQFVQNEIKRLESKIAISKTAETAYFTALQDELGDE